MEKFLEPFEEVFGKWVGREEAPKETMPTVGSFLGAEGERRSAFGFGVVF